MSAEMDRELGELRRQLRAMGEATETRVHTALEALSTGDLDLARSIRAADDEIDRLDLEIEIRCMEIIARHQPVAGDLRYLMAVLRINTALERIADLCRGVAKRTIRLCKDGPCELPAAVESMGDAVRSMLTEVLRALETQDAELARYVRRSDEFVDQRNREIYAWACAQIEKHPQNTKRFVDVIVLGRAIERIGDHCGNIAEDVIFAVQGEVVRHAQLE